MVFDYIAGLIRGSEKGNGKLVFSDAPEGIVKTFTLNVVISSQWELSLMMMLSSSEGIWGELTEDEEDKASVLDRKLWEPFATLWIPRGRALFSTLCNDVATLCNYSAAHCNYFATLCHYSGALCRRFASLLTLFRHSSANTAKHNNVEYIRTQHRRIQHRKI